MGDAPASIGEVRRTVERLVAEDPTATAWIVGGAVREELRGRVFRDLDLAIAGDGAAARVARALARVTGGFAFPLSDAFGAWRVSPAGTDAGDPDPAWQVDLTPRQGDDLRADLGARDLTVNAIAAPLAGGPLVDPFGGREDLAAGRLRMVSDRAFAADPVRVVRLARFAAELGFVAEPRTLEAARAVAPTVPDAPGERLLPELQRILAGDGWDQGLRTLAAAGVLGRLLPAAVAPDGALRPDLHRDLAAVWDAAATVPEAAAPDRAALAARTAGRADRWWWGLALLLAAPDGAPAPRTLDRLRPSRRLREAVGRTHTLLRTLGSDGRGLRDDRALYRAVRPLGPDGPAALVVARTVLGADAAPWAALLARALRWADRPPTPPIRGDRLADALGMARGPALGELLEELTIAADSGAIASADDAIAWARRRAAERAASGDAG